MSSVTAVPLRPVKRSYLIYLWIGIALCVVAAVALAQQSDPKLLRESRAGNVVTTASGLKYEVLTPGAATGPKPTDADVALINYEGRLIDGKTFDKSQQPTPMPVAGVVPGFSEALKLMGKGAKYRFWLPPQLGYGAAGAGPIPPNAMLVFDVELIDFLPTAVVQQMQARQRMMQGGAGAMPGGAAPTGAPATAPGGN